MQICDPIGYIDSKWQQEGFGQDSIRNLQTVYDSWAYYQQPTELPDYLTRERRLEITIKKRNKQKIRLETVLHVLRHHIIVMICIKCGYKHKNKIPLHLDYELIVLSLYLDYKHINRSWWRPLIYEIGMPVQNFYTYVLLYLCAICVIGIAGKHFAYSESYNKFIVLNSIVNIIKTSL